MYDLNSCTRDTVVDGIKMKFHALQQCASEGAAQEVEWLSCNQKVTGSIPHPCQSVLEQDPSLLIVPDVSSVC